MSADLKPSNEMEFPPIEYGVTEAALAELKEQYANPDASTDEGYEHCKEGVKHMTSLRTAIETRRKDLKRPALDWGAKVDSIAKDLIRRVKAIEAPVAAEKEKVDEAARKKAKAELDAKIRRDREVGERIESITAMAREQMPGDSAADYERRIRDLKALTLTAADYDERVDEAEQARDAALYKLTAWHERAVEREAEDARRAKQDAELAERQRKLDEQEAQQRAQREKAEAEQRAAAEKAEQEKREAEAREQKRIDTIRARIDLIRDTVLNVFDQSAAAIEQTRNVLASRIPDEVTYEELLPEAKKAHADALAKLDQLHTERVAEEAKEQAEAEARKSDAVKLAEWAANIENIVSSPPRVLDPKAVKLMQQYRSDMAKAVERLQTAINKL